LRPLDLSILPETLAIARLPASVPEPAWGDTGLFRSVTRTHDELSIVCEDGAVPEGVQAARGWRAIRVAGTLEFTATGILSSLTAPLAEARISIFALSTHDTDYVLVRDEALGRAVDVLTAAGHRFFEHKP
jgi:hypothetical protein